MRFNPNAIFRGIRLRLNLAAVLANVGWLVFDRILRLGVGLLVGVWTARYLGPTQFGLLSFALACTGVIGSFALLGLQGIVVRELVRNPDTAGFTLGTAAVLLLIAGVGAYLLSIGAIHCLRPNDPIVCSIVALLGSLLVLKFSDISLYWFESQVQSKYVVIVQTGVFLVFSIIKAFLILQLAPLSAFVWAMFAEGVVVSVLLLVILHHYGPSLARLRASTAKAKELLRDSWPLALSGLAIMVYMRIDQIMIGQMIGDEAAGIYSAATRVSEVWYFIPMVIVATVFPTLLKTKKHSEDLYYLRLQQLYDSMVWLSILISLPLTFLAAPIIDLLYGASYAEAGPVLAVHIWASVFVFLGTVSGKWFVIENRLVMGLHRTLLGAGFNIALNFAFIPTLGPLGAAWATLVSYAVAALLADLMQSETRRMFRMKLRAFNIVGCYNRNYGEFKHLIYADKHNL